MAQGVPGRLRPRIFLTFRHYDGGRSSAIRTGRLYPRRNPWYSFSEAESNSGHMVLSGVPRKKSPVTSPGIDPGTVRLVTQCLNHYATPGQNIYIYTHTYIHNKTSVKRNIFTIKKIYREVGGAKDLSAPRYYGAALCHYSTAQHNTERSRVIPIVQAFLVSTIRKFRNLIPMAFLN